MNSRGAGLLAVIAGALAAGVATVLPWFELPPELLPDDDDLWAIDDGLAAVVLALSAAAALLAVAGLLTGARAADLLAALAATGAAANMPTPVGFYGLAEAGAYVAVAAAVVLVAGAVAALAPAQRWTQVVPLAVAFAAVFVVGLTVLADGVGHQEVQVVR
ncbi:MAG TPA: hypothetical protein VHF89_09455 [Solirubrobacteraceae bacterium]|nr:hypothetical protein [Solirubrobacteraceae bacterium]